MLPNDLFISELEKIESIIQAEIQTLLKNRNVLTVLEQMQLLEEYNIQTRMIELGYNESLVKYVESFDNTVVEYTFVKKITNEFVDEVELIQKNLGEYLLGKQQQYYSQLTMEIQSGIMSGKLDAEIIKSLSDIPLSDRQLKTVVDTAYQNHSRNITRNAFEGDKEQEFEYVGGLIPTSSDACREVVESGETYTMAEIDKGIPAGGTIVNWGGREPNFNCGHSWEPVEPEKVKK